jgi:lipopolysaccharide biosynthesis glycosyltransferase
MNVACAADERYAPHAATALRSVLAHAPGARTHLLHSGLSRRTARRLRESVPGLALHEVGPERVAGLPDLAARGITRTMWLRVFLPELLADAARVLYLDCDVLVCDDLAPLWATDLGDAYVGAVTNVWEPWAAGHPATLGLEPGEYFNSGVLLLDLERMRADAISERLLEHAASGDLRWPDQDALNVVMRGRRVTLHPRWNAMNSLAFPQAAETYGAQAADEAHRAPGLRHFEGPDVNKPWHLLCPWDGREVYRRHRRETAWPRYLPAGLTPRNVWRRVTA